MQPDAEERSGKAPSGCNGDRFGRLAVVHALAARPLRAFSLTPDGRFLLLAIVCIAVAGACAMHALEGSKMHIWADSHSYHEARQLLADLGFEESRHFRRGQLFPLAWSLSEWCNVRYSSLAVAFNALGCIFLCVAARRSAPAAGFSALAASAIILTSRDNLSWATTFLTESLMIGVLSFALAGMCRLGRSLEQARRSGVRALIRGGLWFLLAVLIVHTWKAWIVLLPLSFLGALLLAELIAATAGRRRPAGSLLLGLAALLMLGAALPRAIHSPRSDSGPAASNVVRFLVRARVDTYIDARLAGPRLSRGRSAELAAVRARLGDAVATCSDRWQECPFRHGKAMAAGYTNYAVFRTAYLNDLDGVWELLEQSAARILQNFEQAESLQATYGEAERGHRLLEFASLSSLLAAGGLAIWFAVRLVLASRRAGTRAPRARAEERALAELGFALLASSFSLLLFLGLAGGIIEMPRSEAPGVYSLLLALALSLGIAWHLVFSRPDPLDQEPVADGSLDDES